MGEYFRQKALSHFGALMVIPSFSVISIILTSGIGLIFFEEYKELKMQQAMLFLAGTIVTICGVLLLSIDIGKLWTGLYGEDIMVALMRYEDAAYRYAPIICYGGPISEYFQQYFFKQPAICRNVECDHDPIESEEQMIGKNSIV